MACDLYSLAAATSLKRKNLANTVIYDAREVYTELPTVTGKPLAKAFWKRVENRGLRRTDIVVSTGPHDVQAILNVHGFIPRTVLVRNMPWREEVRRDRTLLAEFRIPFESIVLVYVGGLQIGRGLQQIIHALRSLTQELALLLIGAGTEQAALQRIVEEHGLGDRVRFAGARPADQAMRIAAACDVGIALIEPISRSYELALPSKLFEYMIAGLPVISSRLQQVVELFPSEPWLSYADPADSTSIVQAIREAVQRSSDTALRQQEKELALSQYHFEHDAVELLKVIEERFA